MQRTGSHVRFPILMIGIAIALLAGCTAEKEISTPVDAPERFSESGTSVVPERWWTSFDDPKLDTLVQTALDSNFTIRSAWYRLRSAQAVVTREKAGLFPTLDGSVQGSYSDVIYEFQDSEDISIGLNTSYEVDLWGRIRSQVQAEQYRMEAARSDYQTAALSLSAEITRTWYQLAEARNQLQLVNQQIETNRRMLELLENRFGSGQIRGVDILRQRQLVEASREQKTNVERRIKLLEHQLAVLKGQSPQQLEMTMQDSLPELPALPETGLPVELVQRRPDVQSAFNRLKAADRDLASAISSQYPRLNFSASISTASSNVTDLFQQWAYSLGGGLVAPILYGGELSAEVDRAEAVKQQQLYDYGQTVLIAFREVEDALVREQKQVESIQSLEKQLSLAEQTYDQLRLEYFNGTADYLDVLTALNEVQQLRRDLLSSRLALVEYRIGLYRSLAGSFDTGREISPSE